MQHGQVLFIAVGTPSSEDGSADLRYVLSVGDAVARHREKPVILVEKSTVPVGTGDTLKAHIERPWTGAPCSSISSPTRNSSRKARRFPIAAARTGSSSVASAKKSAT